MENPIKMDDLGAHPYFWETSHIGNGWKSPLKKLVGFGVHPVSTAPDYPRKKLFVCLDHQTFQVPKMEVRNTYISCMDTAYVREVSPPRK